MDWFKQNWLSVMCIILYGIANIVYAIIYFKNKHDKDSPKTRNSKITKDMKKIEKLNNKVNKLKSKWGETNDSKKE